MFVKDFLKDCSSNLFSVLIEVLRTETLGYLTVEFHTTFKDFQSLGYDSSINLKPEFT